MAWEAGRPHEAILRLQQQRKSLAAFASARAAGGGGGGGGALPPPLNEAMARTLVRLARYTEEQVSRHAARMGRLRTGRVAARARARAGHASTALPTDAASHGLDVARRGVAWQVGDAETDEIRRMHLEASKNCPSWEKVHYHQARFLDNILVRNLATAKRKEVRRAPTRRAAAGVARRLLGWRTGGRHGMAWHGWTALSFS